MSVTEEMIEKALETGGWGSLQDLTKKAAGDQSKIMDAAKAEAGIVAAVFATPEGKKLLAWLIGKTLMRPPNDYENTAQTLEAYAIAKARREGQNGIVYMILHALDVARQK